VNEGELTELLRTHASRHSVPGAAIGILQERAVATAYYGVADVRTGEPVTQDSLFSPGSLTKSMVATVIAELAEAGKLSLDDPLPAHVPEVHGKGWAERVTLRDLLTNRSHLPMTSDLEFGFEGRTDPDDNALSRLVAEIPTGGPPRDFWSYTNVGWCLLGRVIETAAGATWEDAMRHYLFGAAGMTATAFATTTMANTRVSGHEVTAYGPRPLEPLVARAYGPAGTTVISTVIDLLRFAALHLENPFLAALRAVQAEVPIYGWLDSWCLGWARFKWGAGQVWGWDGLINGERSILRIVPEHKAAIVLMTNSGAGRAMYRTLFTELMESLFGITVPPLRLVPSPTAPSDLSRYSGVYAWPDRRVEVSATDTALTIRHGVNERDALPLDQRTFLVDAADPDNPTVTFGAFDATGRPGVLYLMLWGLPRIEE
jgi:CubicO group peptidase (beta-lactamase class C family)